jgi:hypothetical protein
MLEFELVGIDERPPQEVMDFLADSDTTITEWRRVWVHDESAIEVTMPSRWPQTAQFEPWWGLLPYYVMLRRIPNSDPPLFAGVEQPGVGFWAILIPDRGNPNGI